MPGHHHSLIYDHVSWLRGCSNLCVIYLGILWNRVWFSSAPVNSAGPCLRSNRMQIVYIAERHHIGAYYSLPYLPYTCREPDHLFCQLSLFQLILFHKLSPIPAFCIYFGFSAVLTLIFTHFFFITTVNSNRSFDCRQTARWRGVFSKTKKRHGRRGQYCWSTSSE